MHANEFLFRDSLKSGGVHRTSSHLPDSNISQFNFEVIMLFLGFLHIGPFINVTKIVNSV